MRGEHSKIMDHNYRLLAFDLDGTLTNSDKIITPRTYDALMRAQEQGVRVALASGRPTYGILPLAEQLRLTDYDGYILAFNGGKIVKCRTKEILFQQTIPPELLHKVYETAEQYHLTAMTYENDTIVTEHPNNPYVQIESKICHLPIRQVVHMDEAVDFPVVKFLLVGDEDYLGRIEPEVQAALGDGFDVYRSAGFFFEVVTKGIDKGACLQHVLDAEGWTREQLMTFGDSYNDATMLQFAGVGVAMGNGVPEIRALADYVTGSNYEDGIADALEHFGIV